MNTETCWTCRVRKKRCDRKRPICGACHSLEITCYNGNSRPSWVDNERERDEFTDRVKAQIRERAECRRKKSYVKVMSVGKTKKSKASIRATGRSKLNQRNHTSPVREEDAIESPSHECLRSNMSLAKDRQPNRDFTNPTLLEISDDIDLDLEITFLDYAFPFLFPFYRPSMFEGGRGWLLATLRSSMPLFHTAMGFSTYFFILVMTDIADGQHETCKGIIEDKLTSHVDTAIKAMREGIEYLGTGPKPGSIFERAHLMESVVQLLVFETNIARTTEWNIHITAAISLFREILELCEQNHDGRADINSIMAMMQRPGWPTETSNHRRWNSDQSAFRFHIAFLIFADIISATTLGDAPRLSEFYSLLIKDKTGAAHPNQLLELRSFIGCEGWILFTVADITTLAKGKRQGRMSLNDVLFEGNKVGEKLESGIANLKAKSKHPMPAMACTHAYVNSEALLQSADTIPFSLIWAHAAVLYLFVTTSGWQEEHQIVRENVACALNLLQEVSLPAILRGLAWPFCVIGCLAAADQEEDFRQIASKMGPLSAFGTLYEALKIIEKVWSTRGERDADNWDFASCFSILGPVPLLI